MQAATFAAIGFTLLVAHQVADHWLQSAHQAAHKGDPGWVGRLACLKHVASYTATTLLLTGLVIVLMDLPVSLEGLIVGQLLSAISHYWADRRFTLKKMAVKLGKEDFYNLGSPRPGYTDNPSLGTGAYALDQSWHVGWLFIAAIFTTLL